MKIKPLVYKIGYLKQINVSLIYLLKSSIPMKVESQAYPLVSCLMVTGNRKKTGKTSDRLF